VVEDDQLGARRRYEFRQLRGLAGSDEELRLGRAARAAEASDDLRAGGLRQELELLAGIRGRFLAERQLHENGALTGIGAVKLG
jgi:hypothetical protein